MIRRLALIRRPAAVALTLVLAAACGGGSNSPVAPVPTPTATGSPNPAPTPVQGSCPLGLGSGKFTCQGDTPGLWPRVEAAIDKLVRERPSLFNTENPPSAGGYLVYDVDAFYDGVIDNLTADGLCAQRSYADKDKLSVKEDNSYNEVYDIITTQNRIRRGPVTYQMTCTPANFPLTAETGGGHGVRLLLPLHGLREHDPAPQQHRRGLPRIDHRDPARRARQQASAGAARHRRPLVHPAR